MEDFFRKHKLILLFFTLMFIVYVTAVSCNYRGAFFDSLGQFFAFIDDIIKGKDVHFVFLRDYRTRHFSNFLSVIPLNISLLFGVSDLKLMLKVFTASFYLMTFVSLIGCYFVAKRTKRFDLAVWAFVFYSFFIVPGSVWFTREIRIAIVLQFALLIYFLSREKLSKKDIVPISLLVIYMFESFETSFLYGIMLFVAGLIYYKKDPAAQNSLAKVYIGVGTLCASIYIYFMTLHWQTVKDSNINPHHFLELFISQSKNTFEHFFDSSLLITGVGLLFALFVIFFEKEFRKKHFPYLIPISLLIIVILQQKTQLIPRPYMELDFYTLPLIFSLPSMCILIMSDYLDWRIGKFNKNFYSNAVVISCIVGILHFSWQINSSIDALNYVKYFKSTLEKSKKTIIHMPKEIKKKDLYVYDSCFGTMQRSLLFSPDYKVETMVFPSMNSRDYGPDCKDGLEHTHYSSEDNKLALQYSVSFKVKNKYWDLTDIVKEFKNQDMVK